MSFLKQSTVALAAAAMLSSVAVQQARADILPSATSPVVTAVSGGFNWDYDATLTSVEQLETGNFFVIYDFGVGSLVSAPAGWTLTTSAFSPTSVTGSNGTVTPTQTDALNYTFTYTGATVVGPGDLGHFILKSTVGIGTTVSWVGQAHDVNTDLLNANITNTLAPVTTPEPASLALLATGLVGLAGVARRRNKTAA